MRNSKSEQLREFMQANMQRLPYHNPEHGLDVAETALDLALMEDCSDKIEICYAFGLTHDLVYHLGATWGENERKSIVLAGLIMPGFGYTSEEISETQRMIMATAFPYKERPKDILEKIARDADLANNGREDFWEKSAAVFKEKNMLRVMKGEPLMSYEQFAKDGLYFLEHLVEFHTASARELYGHGLARNIARVREIVAKHERTI